MLAFVMLLWSGNSIVGRAVRDDVPPLALAFIRWLGALAVVTPIALRSVLAERAEIRRGWVALLLLGLLGVGAFNALLYSGLQHTTAANALLMQATIPPMVLLLGWLLGDRTKLGQVLGVTLSTLGVAIIVFKGDVIAVARLEIGFGDGLILVGCIAWALYTVGLRYRPPVSPATFLFVTFLVGVLATAPLAAVETLSGRHVHLSTGVLIAFAYVAVLPSVVAYFLYNAAVTAVGAAPAGQAIAIMPLIGALLAAFLLGEPLEPYHGAAMALILAGVVIAGWAARQPRELAEA